MQWRILVVILVGLLIGLAGALPGYAQAKVVDLMEGPPDEKTGKKPSLSTVIPRIITATRLWSFAGDSNHPDVNQFLFPR
jgi:hypothetical protein